MPSGGAPLSFSGRFEAYSLTLTLTSIPDQCPSAPALPERYKNSGDSMTDLSVTQNLAAWKPANKVRFVTAASLFDGHDASINIMRRILMANGAEVIHLGHNRSVDDIVTAALQEDAQGIAISSR